MNVKHPVYSHKQILSITKGFETLRDLRRQHKDLADFIQKNHLYTVYCKHMRRSNSKLTMEYLRLKCQAYKDPIELRKKDNRLYYYLVNNNLLKTLFPATNHRLKHSKQSLLKLIKPYKTISDFRRCHPGAYDSAVRQNLLSKIVGDRPQNSYTTYSKKEIKSLIKQFSSMTEFQAHYAIAYHRAKKNQWLPELKKLLKSKPNRTIPSYSISNLKKLAKKYKTLDALKKAHPFSVSKFYKHKLMHLLKNKAKRVSNRELQIRANRYTYKGDFCKYDHAGYMMAFKRGILDKICAKMKLRKRDYTNQELRQIAKQYIRRSDFRKHNEKAYIVAHKRGLLDNCCAHMNPKDSDRLIPESTLAKIALKYKHKSDFFNNDHAAYEAVRRRGLINKLCKHMTKKTRKNKKAESELLKFIQSLYQDAKNQWFYNLKVPKRPYIKAFEIDVYVPSLNKGIELDGTFWHSYKQLVKSRKSWPKTAVKQYHQIKDKVFLESFDIPILHITDKEWIYDREVTKTKIIDFLTS